MRSADSAYNLARPHRSDTGQGCLSRNRRRFCTVGAPLTPIAPTTSPSTLMGTLPPHDSHHAGKGGDAS